jgi:hypothetical protein
MAPPGHGKCHRGSSSNLPQVGFAFVADFLLRGHPDAASGAEMIRFFRMGEVAVTGGAVSLAHPYGCMADRTLGHEEPSERAAFHLDIKYSLESLCPGESPQ